MSSILRYIFITCSLLLMLNSAYGQNATDTAADAPVIKLKDSASHQLCGAIDIFQPIMNHVLNYREGYEFEADYYVKNEVYGVVEGGWGNAHFKSDKLDYTSSNSFFRVGFNKSLLPRVTKSDWDMVFIGLRYAMGFVQRSTATYTIVDSLWGNTTGTKPSASFVGYWAEITGGMRVELAKNFFVGYNIRGKFLLSQKAFQTLAPVYVAGYGRGDKNSIFDFNFYLTYALRWKRHV
ncbi:MAG: hypothetical protein H0X33_09470 [Taibaiella sp.]|nr:hypothetical protein [Taibaiella sp.]